MIAANKISIKLQSHQKSQLLQLLLYYIYRFDCLLYNTKRSQYIMEHIPRPQQYRPQQYQQDYWYEPDFQTDQTEQPQNMRATRMGTQFYRILTADQKNYQRYSQFAVARKEHTLHIQTSKQKDSHQITRIQEFPELHEGKHERVEIQLNQLNGLLDIWQRGSTRLFINTRGIQQCKSDNKNQWRVIDFMNEVGYSAIDKLIMHKQSWFSLSIYGRDQNEMLNQSLVGMLFRSLSEMINTKFSHCEVNISMEKEEHEQMRVEHYGAIFQKSDFLNTFRLKCKMVPIEVNIK